jgi:hypothetical protein
MKNQVLQASVLLISFLLMNTAARAGAEGHGGDAIEFYEPLVFQLYSMDLAEYGYHKSGSLDFKRAKGADADEIAKIIDENYRASEDVILKENYPFSGESRLGFINKLLQIKKVSPSFYRALMDAFVSLKWTLVDYPLRAIEDEDTLIGSSKYQLAIRKDSWVRITKLGYAESFRPSLNDYWRVPLDRLNRVALLTHELVYAITVVQGDTTSKRAREANAYLYSPAQPEKAIERAAHLLGF